MAEAAGYPLCNNIFFFETKIDIRLQSWRATEGYLQVFRPMPFRLVFPIINTVLFKTTIDEAYHPILPSLGAQACALAFLSIMSHMQWVPNSSVVVDGRACAQQAELLMGLVVAETNLVELQYHVMQCMHQIFPGNLQTAVMCHTFAYRILFVLSGRHPSRPKPIPSDEQARKLFWLASRFDKVLALCTGQPACIEDKNCDLTLPQGYVAMLYSDTDFDSGVVTTLCLYPGDLQVAILSREVANFCTAVMCRKFPTQKS